MHTDSDTSSLRCLQFSDCMVLHFEDLSYYIFIILFIFEICTKLQAARQRPKTVILKLWIFFFSILLLQELYRLFDFAFNFEGTWMSSVSTEYTEKKQKSRNYWPVKFCGFAHIWVAKLFKALQMAICKHSSNSKNWKHISEWTQYKGFSSQKCEMLIAFKPFMEIIGT